MTRHYDLACSACGWSGKDDGVRLSCSCAGRSALLRTAYVNEGLTLCSDSDGLFRYRHWLPISRVYPGAGKDGCFS